MEKYFVTKDTMNEVYSGDIFNYEHIGDNRGFILSSGVSYPVYTILNNKILSQVELNQFMMYNLNEFRRGDNNECERNSKRYLAKQSK